MSLFNLFKKSPPTPQLSDERVIPEKDIISVQTFPQSKSFKGFRRVKISTYNLDGVEKNLAFFRKRGFDFANSRIQIMTVKANNPLGKCLRIVVDCKFIGNIYRSDYNSEPFDAALNKKIDKAYILIEDAVIDGKIYGTEAYMLFHWPDMGPKISVAVE